MRAGGRQLSLTEWVVLALVAEGTTHGFDIARVLDARGSIGQIWTVRRPLVYRAVDSLERAGLVIGTGEEDGNRGPRRRLVRATPVGRRVIARWLEEPVEHIRDVRTELLLKLALLDRAHRSPTKLLDLQRASFSPTIESIVARRNDAEGFDAVLADWRAESAEAVARFLSQR